MKNPVLEDLFREEFYSSIKFNKITGRYLNLSQFTLVKNELSDDFEFSEIGKSVQEKPIELIKAGTGKIKILAWSQMHGNESTTTKAVFDLLNAFKLSASNKIVSGILNNCTLYIIPILNPDGAEAYTRVNANSVDLNRDLQQLSQPESRILMEQYKNIQPDYCLNLHDQRTIFSAGHKPDPATLSFLTPSRDESRSIDESRKKSMGIIAGIAGDLEEQLKCRIGRYDDAFNINCAGDTFQSLSTPTILFEAGHFPGDYKREETRKFVFRALISCLYQISNNLPEMQDYEEYFRIPENEKLFYDIIIRRAKIKGKVKDLSIQFKETLRDGMLEFVPIIEEIMEEIEKYAHREINAEGAEIRLADDSEIIENVIVNKIIINNKELEVKCV